MRQIEFIQFDKRQYADQLISPGLNDGVKVNYDKFGNLLAELKAIAGEAEDD